MTESSDKKLFLTFPFLKQVAVMKKAYPFLLSFIFGAALFISCHQPTSPDSGQLIANAGPDRTAEVGQYVVLDGSGSRGGSGLNFKWTSCASNPSYVYVDAESAKPTPAFTIAGVYTFTLVVSDGINNSRPDSVLVIVSPRDKVEFPDVNLEISLRYATKIPNADISDSLLLSLDTLQAYSFYYKINSLNGIEKCQNLQVLAMSLQQLSDISNLSSLKRLQSLYLDQNSNIVDITALSNLAELQLLNLQLDNVSDVSPLQNLTKLTFLNLMTNPVTDISSLKGLTNVEQLWFDYAPLSGTSVISGFTKLTLLWMTDCNLTDISFVSTLTNLNLFHIGGDHVSDLTPLANCTHLVRLYMDRNNVSEISPLEKLTSLNLLDLSLNKITNILPLVNNTGFGKGAAVALTGNPLDNVSVNQYIPALINRGVIVSWN